MLTCCFLVPLWHQSCIVPDVASTDLETRDVIRQLLWYLDLSSTQSNQHRPDVYRWNLSGRTECRVYAINHFQPHRLSASFPTIYCESRKSISNAARLRITVIQAKTYLQPFFTFNVANDGGIFVILDSLTFAVIFPITSPNVFLQFINLNRFRVCSFVSTTSALLCSPIETSTFYIEFIGSMFSVNLIRFYFSCKTCWDVITKVNNNLTWCFFRLYVPKCFVWLIFTDFLNVSQFRLETRLLTICHYFLK